MLLDFIADHFLIQVVESLTHLRNILDLVITNDVMLISSVEQEVNCYLSDHNTLCLKTIFVWNSIKIKEPKVLYYTSNLHKLKIDTATVQDWCRYHDWMTQRLGLTIEKLRMGAVCSSANCLSNHLHKIIGECAAEVFKPKVGKPLGNFIPLWVRKLMAGKKKKSNQYKVTKCWATLIRLKQEIAVIERRLADSLEKVLREHEEKVIPKIKSDPGDFYSFARSFSNKIHWPPD